MKLILTITILLMPLLSKGEEWHKRVFSKDQDNHYYVGISDSRISLKEAMDEAYLNAVTEAIRHNFGMKGNFSQSMISNLEDLSYQETANLKKDEVNLEGIEPVDELVTEEKNKYKVFRKIKYPIWAINKEKQRLQSETKSLINTYGEGSEKGSIIIETTPPGAQATLTALDQNFEIIGSTNAHFYLPLGKYSLVFLKEGYRPEKKEVIVSGKKSKHHYDLTPSTGTLVVDISPSDALIIIDGRILKNNTRVELIASKNYKIHYEHPDYNSQSETFSVWVDEELELRRELNPKASHINIITNPSDANIYIGNTFIGKSPIKNYQITPRKQSIKAELSGFENEIESIDVKPNRKIGPIVLTLKKEKPKTEYEEPGYENNYKYDYKNQDIKLFKNKNKFTFIYDPIISSKEKTSYTIAPLGLHYFFLPALSFGIDYRYDLIEKSQGTKTIATKISHTIYSSKIYLVRNEYFSLGGGIEWHDLRVKKGPWDSTNQSFKSYEQEKGTGTGGVVSLGINVYETPKGGFLGIYSNYRFFKIKGEQYNQVTLGVSFDF